VCGLFRIVNISSRKWAFANLGKSPNLRPKITFDLIQDWDQGSRGV
jgi:hypothetical protein